MERSEYESHNMVQNHMYDDENIWKKKKKKKNLVWTHILVLFALRILLSQTAAVLELTFLGSEN